MANDTSVRETDVMPHELLCHEVASRSSQVTVSDHSERCASLRGDDVSMSESHGIPEVPGRHKITTYRDVGFFAAASATHEAILSSFSESQTSDDSGTTDGADDAAAGTEHKSSSYLMPLKNAARISDLFRSGTEGKRGEGQLSTLERRESGISINESLLLSVDLTSADLGTICDVNDKNYYQQMVLRSLLTEDKVDQSDSGRRTDAPDVASALDGGKHAVQEVQNHASESEGSLAVAPVTSCDNELARVECDERTSKFRIVQLECSSQDVFEDATESNTKNSGENLAASQTPHDTTVNPAEKTKMSMEEVVVNGVLNSTTDNVSNSVCEEGRDVSISDVLPISDSKNVCDSDNEIETFLQKYSSGDNATPSLAENEVTRPAEELSMKERDGVADADRASQPERDDKSPANRSVLFLQALFRAGAGNSVATAVRAALCFTAAFIMLYAPSTLINILTLYLQLLVCAIFVDIFLN